MWWNDVFVTKKKLKKRTHPGEHVLNAQAWPTYSHFNVSDTNASIESAFNNTMEIRKRDGVSTSYPLWLSTESLVYVFRCALDKENG